MIRTYGRRRRPLLATMPSSAAATTEWESLMTKQRQDSEEEFKEGNERFEKVASLASDKNKKNQVVENHRISDYQRLDLSESDSSFDQDSNSELCSDEESVETVSTALKSQERLVETLEKKLIISQLSSPVSACAKPVDPWENQEFIAISTPLTKTKSKQLPLSAQLEKLSLNVPHESTQLSECHEDSHSGNDDEFADEKSSLLHSIRKNSLHGTEKSRRSSRPAVREKLQQQVLSCCQQETFITFEEFASQWTDWEKIGEATFSEVFSALPKKDPTQDRVIKILPFTFDEHLLASDNDTTNNCRLAHGRELTKMEDLVQEIVMTRILSESFHRSAFVRFYGAVVFRGRYPDSLLKCWDEWNEENDSDNLRPDDFTDQQYYCALILDDAGTDLEHVELKNYLQAQSVFRQLTYTLALVEQRLEFEHRDLHWGNVLLKLTDEAVIELDTAMESRTGELDTATRNVKIESYGVKCSIIDYSFSRLKVPNSNSDEHVLYRAYNDPDFFTGSGDYQFEIYRMMRDLINPQSDGDWRVFRPKTSIFWLDYLLDKLLDGVAYSCSKRSKGRRELLALKNRISTYQNVHELIWNDEFFTELEEEA